MNHEIYTPPGGPPQTNSPSKEIYKLMGEENIFKMLEDFYLELEKSSLKGMFPKNMIESSKKSAAFFVGILGGPPLYQQLYGDPRLRSKHFPFPINETAKQVWLDCFKVILDKAGEKYNFPDEYLKGFWDFLVNFSPWMINKK